MDLVDLEPLPIPLLVRYKLIDSCSLAGRVVCHGYYRARASGLKIREGRGEKREERKKRNEERKGEVEVADEKGGVISRRTPERN